MYRPIVTFKNGSDLMYAAQCPTAEAAGAVEHRISTGGIRVQVGGRTVSWVPPSDVAHVTFHKVAMG